MADSAARRRCAVLSVLVAMACGDDAPSTEAGSTVASASTDADGGPTGPADPETTAGTSTTSSGAGDTASTTGGGGSETGTTGGTTGDTTEGEGSSGTTGAVAPFEPELSFTEVSASIGLDYVHGVIATSPNCLVDSLLGPGSYCIGERMSAGFAAGDYDGDGDADLYVPRTYGGDLLLRNEGDGTFSDATNAAGLGREGSSSAAWLDLDNDGDQDLYVTALGDTRHYLYVNDGAGHFTEEGVARNAVVKSPYMHVPYGIALGDYDLDGWVDIYVSEWMSDTGIGKHDSHNRLLHNLGAMAPGYFEDVTDLAGVNVDVVWSEVGAQAGSWGFAPAFADLDGDRWPDLVVVSDFACSRLFWNDGDGTFTDGTVAAGVGLDDNGMGSAFGDIDLDGDLDWFVTAITDPGGLPENRLYRNDGGRSFAEIAEVAGVGYGGWGWGTTFFDPDLDGDADVFMASGYYYTSWLDDPNRMWLGNGTGAFGPDVAPELGLDAVAQTRGVVAFDYDDDGDEDLFLANNAEAPLVYRNDTATPHDWLRVRVEGTMSNRDGLGARVRVQTIAGGPWQVREVGSSSHFLGQQPKALQFGIPFGGAPIHEVRVYWPVTDTEQVIVDVPRRSELVVVEP